MKRLVIYTVFIFALILGVTGCYRDVIVPDAAVDPDGPPQAVSFKVDLAPIFNTKCNVTGCHASGGHKPYMASDISYLQITNGGFVNTLIPKQSILYDKINGGMKEYIPSASDRQKVYDWIRNGAPNN
ncbi:MAG: hypothetical protein ABI581_07340 [Sediminibacterium sp.]